MSEIEKRRTRRCYLEEAQVVRVEASHEVLVKRLVAEKNKRPLLAHGPLSESLAALLAERREAYQSVSHSVDTGKYSIEQASDLILQRVFGHKELTARLGNKEHLYQVGPGLLQSLGASLVERGARGRVFILADRRAGSHHLHFSPFGEGRGVVT